MLVCKVRTGGDNDLDLSLRNMTFSKDDWQTQEGKLSMNVSQFHQRRYIHLTRL